jgi:hypothetical protein
LRAVRRPRTAPSSAVAPPETTELAGEIVAAELPDQALLGSVGEAPVTTKPGGGR